MLCKYPYGKTTPILPCSDRQGTGVLHSICVICLWSCFMQIRQTARFALLILLVFSSAALLLGKWRQKAVAEEQKEAAGALDRWAHLLYNQGSWYQSLTVTQTHTEWSNILQSSNQGEKYIRGKETGGLQTPKETEMYWKGKEIQR